VVEIETGQHFRTWPSCAVWRCPAGGTDGCSEVTSKVGYQIVPQIINTTAQYCEMRASRARTHLDEVFLRLTGTLED